MKKILNKVDEIGLYYEKSVYLISDRFIIDIIFISSQFFGKNNLLHYDFNNFIINKIIRLFIVCFIIYALVDLLFLFINIFKLKKLN